MLQEILHLGQRAPVQNPASLLLRREELVIPRAALLDALDVGGHLVCRLDEIVQPLFGFAAEHGCKGGSDLLRQRPKQLVTGQLLDLLVGVLNLGAVIFDWRRQVPGEDLAAVVIERDDGALVGIAVLMEHISADDAERVRNHSHHVTVLLNVFREGVAHQAPPADVLHSG